MDERIKKLYAVAGVEPRDDDVCVVDTRSMSLVQGGAIWNRGAGEELAGELNAFVGERVFKAVPTADCGPMTAHASRVVRRQM